MFKSLKFFALLSLSISTFAHSSSLSLFSNDIAQGEFMSKAHEFNGFGCSGDDLSPHLKWSNAPEGTKSFAITVYDPDAPTGSGWWHWQIINIPNNILEIETGAGSVGKNSVPQGSVQISNDYDIQGFGGACPPSGHGVHHYRFTIHALSIEKLELPEGASGALAGYMINANTIESSSIEALYKRD